MAIVKPFRAVRPAPQLVDKVAALPYDVMSSDEAREMVRGNPYSFLHVDKAEIDLDPSIDLYDTRVYEKARENLHGMIEEGVFIKENSDCLYLYQQKMGERKQIGVVACASIDDYLNNLIKKHELTRADKEQDRIKHVDYCDANTGPIFLTYRSKEEIDALVQDWVQKETPIYDFVSEDGIAHTIWVVHQPPVIQRLLELFAQVECLYIADGHHRSASAVQVGQMRRAANPGYSGDEEYNFFLSVIFPDNQLQIMDYNRVVKDLNGLSSQEFLQEVSQSFNIEPYQGSGPYKPEAQRTFGMYLDGQWYILKAKEGSFDDNDPVKRLDVSIMQYNLLGPILGITDPRTDKRIDFVGGIRGLQELARRVDEGMKVAFSMYPTTIQDLMDIADADKIMPPKSTWFEPKLRSGIFIHQLR
ncbi:MAG: DUF1015 domain-containing protein [Syntrophomonadaceae bacterium]|jgi:uncharacterized protein (DUF1015 family)|nr:DUF1015 domain-containing protein [Syntrophomonadaceae bacterium]